MDVEALRDYCLSKKAAEECFPFDNQTLVFKVMGKMFALVGLEDGTKVNLKCDPEYAIELREKYMEIQPGWHMAKTNWNTVQLNGLLGEKMIRELIDHSYECVVKGMTKKMQKQLEDLKI